MEEEFFNNAQHKKVRVRHVHVDGVSRTRGNLVGKQIERVLDVQTFGELMHEVNHATANLSSLNVFKKVEVQLDTTTVLERDPDGVTGVDVTFVVDEKKRVSGKTGTKLGNNEGNVHAELDLCNVFGRADQFSFKYGRGTRRKRFFHASFTKPIAGRPRRRFNVEAYQSQVDNTAWGSHFSLDRALAINFTTPSQRGRHDLAYAAVWRHVTGLPASASWQVRSLAGHTLKSSLKHTFTIDRRDSPSLPTRGALLALSSELAGLGGDLHFLKQELEATLSRRLGATTGWSGTAALRAGYVRARAGEAVHVGDRFFLGGPHSVRHFLHQGLGPRAGGDSLGGDMFWAAGLHLHGPLPFVGMRSQLPLRLHGFWTAGNLALSDPARGMLGNAGALARDWRSSCGAGFVLSLGIARLELNYGLPLRAGPCDATKPGFQVGLGVSFL